MKKTMIAIMTACGLAALLTGCGTGNNQAGHHSAASTSSHRVSRSVSQQPSRKAAASQSSVTDQDEPAASSASSTTTDADPQAIGTALYQHVFDTDDEPEYCEQDGDKWAVGQGTADSTVPFQINGDTVTYWTQDPDEPTAAGKNIVNTISIDDLLGQ